MVGQALERDRVLATELEARQGPGKRSAERLPRAKHVEELDELDALRRLEPVVAAPGPAREAERHGLPGPLVGAPPSGRSERRRPRLEQAQRREELPERDPCGGY